MRNYKKFIRDTTYFPLSYYEISELTKLCNVAKKLDHNNEIPASSSNFSIRTKENSILISRSGLHKRHLTPKQFIRTNLNGIPLQYSPAKPSDETLLHAVIYKNFNFANAVIHCHAPIIDKVKFNLNASEEQKTVTWLKLQQHELIKALGFKSHENEFYIPILKNSQDMEYLSREIENNVFNNSSKNIHLCSFILEHHGIYCFADNVELAEIKLEALLHLIKTNSTMY